MNLLPTKCRAKNPATCPFHGQQEVTAESWYQSYLASKQANLLPSSTEVVGSALKSELSYSGEKPKWWNKFTEQSINHPEVSSKPELLDVINSPIGQLAVVWQPKSQEENDSSAYTSGMNINVIYFKSVKTGDTLGYVKLTSVDQESSAAAFGEDEFTPFRWHNRFSGNHYAGIESSIQEENSDPSYQNQDLSLRRKQVWVSSRNAFRLDATDSSGENIAHYNVTLDHAPDDATVMKDLKGLSVELKKKMNNHMQYFSTPYVDYADLEEPLKGKGYGTALYVYASKRLAQNGQVLRGSGVQSEDAQALWERFGKKFPKNVSTVELDYEGRKQTAPILDFRS